MIKTIYDPESLGLQIARRNGDEIYVFCPFHHDSNPSGSYNVKSGLFWCFSCHASKQAWEIADELGGSLIPISSSLIEWKQEEEDYEWRKLLLSPAAIGNKYLDERIVDTKKILKYNIMSTKNGILFPLKDKFGETKGLQLRQYTKKPKYLFYGEKPSLWGFENILKSKDRTVFITEGIFGALRLENFGGLAVALLGSGNVLKAGKIVRNSCRSYYSFMDNDYAGLLAAGKLILMGIPAILYPKPADELKEQDALEILYNLRIYIENDVNKIIEISENPAKMEKTLKKFWRKL